MVGSISEQLDGYNCRENGYPVGKADPLSCRPEGRIATMMYIIILSSLFVGGILYILKEGAAIIKADEELMDKQQH